MWLRDRQEEGLEQGYSVTDGEEREGMPGRPQGKRALQDLRNTVSLEQGTIRGTAGSHQIVKDTDAA